MTRIPIIVMIGLFAASIGGFAAQPRALLLGDSVYRQLAGPTSGMLNNRVQVEYPKINYAGVVNSSTALESLDDWLGDGKWDLIHFNFGLGDLIHVAPNMNSFRVLPINAGGVVATPPERYRQNLERIVKRLKATGAKLVWANTTPIRHSASNVFRLGSEIEYNAIAAEVMAAHNIPTNDMYAYVKGVINMDKPASHGADPFNFDRKPIHARVVKSILANLDLLQPLTEPVKVVVMLGDWSHIGGGIVIDRVKPRPQQAKGTLDDLVLNPATAADYDYLLAADGKWAIRSDVWIQFDRRNTNSGALGPGFGGDRLRDIGTELSLGHALGDHFDQQLLLLKTTLGTPSLSKDLQPPGAGDPGKLWQRLTTQIPEALTSLDDKFPDYDPAVGYELAALVINMGNQNDNPETYAKYLPLLIDDLRRELNKPNLPTVIVGTGLGGHEKTDFPELIKAQQATAALPRFKDTVAYVETRDFWPPPDARDAYRHATHEQWYHNARSFVDVGRAIADATINLLARNR